MPSKMQHELNKVRGIVSATGELYTDNIASLNDKLIDLKKELLAIRDTSNKHLTKINKALTDVSSLYSDARQHDTEIKTLDDLIDHNQDILRLNVINNNEKTLDTNGIITVDNTFHTVDTFGGAASDNLEIINGGVDRQILIIRPDSDARTIVIERLAAGGGNIVSVADITMASATDFAVLIYDSTYWYVVAYSLNNTRIIYTDTINEGAGAAGVTIDSLLIQDGVVPIENAGGVETCTLDTNGTITPTKSFIQIDTFEGAATDNLDHIYLTNFKEGDIITVKSYNMDHDVTIRDTGAGGGCINMEGNANFALLGSNHFIRFLVVDVLGTLWCNEISRFNG